MEQQELLARLQEPFPPAAIEWKPGIVKGERCLVMAYCDMRAYMRRLDEVCGLDWSLAYEPWGDDRIIAKLTIAGVTRSSTGEHNAQDLKNNLAGTVAEAQAMKRAAAMFGLGRYLYEFDSQWVAYDAKGGGIAEAAKRDLETRYQAWYDRKMRAIEAKRKPAEMPAEAPTEATQPRGGSIQTQEEEMPAEPEMEAQEAMWEPNETHTAELVNFGELAGLFEGPIRKFIDTAKQINANSDGPASERQYEFLSGEIDRIVGKDLHHTVLGILCGRPVSKANPVGKNLAQRLLDTIMENRNAVGEDGRPIKEGRGYKKEPNPNYSQQVVDTIKAIHDKAFVASHPPLPF